SRRSGVMEERNVERCRGCPSRKSKSVAMRDIDGSCLHSSLTLLCCSWYASTMRLSTMLPVIAALRAFVVSLFQARRALHLRVLALQHPVAVDTQTIPRPRLRPTDRLCWTWLSRVWPGWQDALAFVQPRPV